MHETERYSKFKEIVKLTNHPTVNLEFVKEAWEWKARDFGVEVADKLLEEQIKFEQKRRGGSY